MSTTGPADRTPSDDPPDLGPPGTPGDTSSPKHRNVWIWVSAGLAVAAAGLLIWGLSTRSDLDSTESDLGRSQQQVQDLEAEAEQSKEAGGTVAAGIKAAYEDLTRELGSTQEDLAAATKDVDEAQQASEQAEDDAAAAKREAEKAGSESDELEAEAEQAKAQAQAVESKASIAAKCANAYVAAVGALFEGDSVRDQAAAVRKDLEGISAQCKTALEGT